jgi:hypothetical protein
VARDTVAQRARVIYAYLRGQPDHAMGITELCRRLGIRRGDTTRRALREVARLARADGYVLRVPCPTNGYMLALTSRAEMLLASAGWLARTANGVLDREAGEVEGIRADLASLPATLRPAAEEFVQAREVVHLANAMGRRALDRMEADRRAAVTAP